MVFGMRADVSRADFYELLGRILATRRRAPAFFQESGGDDGSGGGGISAGDVAFWGGVRWTVGVMNSQRLGWMSSVLEMGTRRRGCPTLLGDGGALLRF
jgi:hypothetical protein